MTRDERINTLINGAYDLHIHSDPSFMVRSVDTMEAAEECCAAGMLGIAVKDHFVSTAANAYFVNKYMHRSGIKRDFTVYGAICLNNAVGFNLHAVDSALKFGCKQVYLPTIASRSHIEKVRSSAPKNSEASHFIPQKVKGMKQTEMRVIDEKGELTGEVKDIIGLVREFDAMLCTGHIDYDEALAVVKYAKSIGLDKILLTHLPTFTTLDLDRLKTLVDIGGFVEINESQIVEETPEAVRNTREDLCGYIRTFGPERCVIDTDAGSIAFPRPVAIMREAIGAYIDAGFTDGELTVMLKTNPAYLVGRKD